MTVKSGHDLPQIVLNVFYPHTHTHKKMLSCYVLILFIGFLLCLLMFKFFHTMAIENSNVNCSALERSNAQLVPAG